MDKLEPEKLFALVIAAQQASADTREIRSLINRDIKAAVGSWELHPRAFALAVSIYRMDQVKRLALLRAFDAYRKALNLDDETQIELLPEPPTQMRRSTNG